MNPPRAVVLLSGGLDSATILAIARADGFRVHALSFDYGQRHADELEAARRCAAATGVDEHLILELDLRPIGGSALTADIAVPKDRAGLFDPAKREVPATYVPARNTVFLAMALALAEARGASDIYIGVNALDTSGYPDCRPEFITAFEALAAVATRVGADGASPRVRAPLLHMSKAQIIRRGLELGVDYGVTRSCYDPDATGRACGHCDSCRLRLAAFAEVGIPDPAPYR
ncbi:MAG: 7-cyano-7-deazaguanine synthase QueC [Planctomycetia bacterium]|nr:MAG: 7-cyano-7-deazaguanine synthase QueC [Planctomycetia bacterium]